MSESPRSAPGAMKTLVVWDLKVCPIPPGKEADMVDWVKNTTRTLSCNGPVLFKVYGSITHISDELKQFLEANGMIVTVVPNGTAISSIAIQDTFGWARENPPPNSNVVFIRGDDDIIIPLR